MNSPLPRSLALGAALAGLFLLLPARPSGAADRSSPKDPRGPSVTVRPGDSWDAVRGRMFPVQSLKSANPGLDPSMLHPGEVVRSPYVPVRMLDREHAARGDAERRLAEARARVTALEQERAGFERQRRQFARAGMALRALKNGLLGLVVFAAVLLAALGMALQAARAARRRAGEETSLRRAIELRHEALRRSLADIETGLQRRMMGLLHLHGGKIITDKEIDASVRPVIDLAAEIRKKHERA